MLVDYPESDGDDHADAHDDQSPRPPPAAAPAPSESSPAASVAPIAPIAPAAPAVPALPAAFHDLYSTARKRARGDDPDLHAGRQRALPEQPGVWHSHVYLDWRPSAAETTTLAALIQRVQASSAAAASEVHSLLYSDLAVPLPLHISLSRTLPLTTEQRDPFLTTLAAFVRRAGVRPFPIRFTTLQWHPNFAGNRWFLVLGVARPARDELNRLCNASDDAAAAFQMPGLYAQPDARGAESRSGEGTAKKRKLNLFSLPDSDASRSESAAPRGAESSGGGAEPPSFKGDRTDMFHVSIAWTLEPPDKVVRDPLADDAVAAQMEEAREMTVDFDAVKLKMGNAVHNIPFLPPFNLPGRK